MNGFICICQICMKSCQTSRSKKKKTMATVTNLFIIIVLEIFLIVKKNIFNVSRMCLFTYICIYMYIYTNVHFVQQFGCWRATIKAFASQTPEPAENCTSLRCFHKSCINNNKYGFVDFFRGSQY